ncbi:hypothetical protein AWR36_010405 [Microbulbifer flavimaris]|uniref:SCP domain-containing protein n=1 Tax=Microbulbifer flavimaris TaxID=1781068 RepID=A0ABX4HYA9_9GAMM|nr:MULTISPECIES: CAP domain-containing protein [Microbulbifer]KUJ82945.1 hypothetical protein AVO43_10375 [Microbulbifer sp. ZGT114]PCO05130.1 hypothetical protein AWR36_010405 [Microbulbifer flavimaris]
MLRIFILLVLLAPLSANSGPTGTSPACGTPSDCLLVQLHNQVRESLNAGRLPNSPKPSPPVTMLKHDTALARTAHNWSGAQCNSRRGHNKNRRGDYLANGGNPAYPAIGENIFYHSARLPESEALKLAVNSWAAEARDFQFGPFKNLKVGHYTQLIWNTKNAFDAQGRKLPRAVGCGVYHCPSGKFRTIVTCNYAPAGNIYRELPYRVD